MGTIDKDDELLSRLTNLFTDNQIGYGLDFGTFCSMMAYKNANLLEPKAVFYEDIAIRNGIPSLFWYSDKHKQEYVCQDVIYYNGLLDDPDGVCSSVKMKFEEDIILNGKHYTAKYIAEQIVRRVIKDSHAMLKEQLYEEPSYNKLVVGVPVRFGAAVRRNYLNVLRKATNNKDIILLPEPIAAAITYARYGKTSNKKILVFDLGAGTFDTVLLIPNKKRSKENPYAYIPCNPDGLQIAGDYFDIKMAEIIIQKLKDSNIDINFKILTDNKSTDYCRLLTTSRKIKEKLSSEIMCTEMIEATTTSGKPCIQMIKVYRDEFEKSICPLLMQVVDCAYDVLVRSKEQSSKDIDIILVGGSTYIPLVKKMIKKKFTLVGNNVFQKFPEQAVALGCAIYANEELCDTPVAFAYAIGTHLKSSNRDILEVIIPSNVKCPMKKKMTYKTRRRGQESIEFIFFELDYGDENEELDVDEGKITPIKVTHSFMKKVPLETPVDVIVELSKEGLLTVTIDDRGITRVERQTVDINNLSRGDN